MKSIMVAPFSSNLDLLYIAIKEIPTEKIVFIVQSNESNLLKDSLGEFYKFKIPIETVSIDGNLWEETFKSISELKSRFRSSDVIVNISMADRATMCAATSAAFVNGLKAFDIIKDQVMFLPVLKFSYYKILSEKKLSILRILSKERDCCASLDDLGKRVGMSLPLILYHINGNIKSEGMRGLGLVKTQEVKGKIKVSLTELGILIVKGYIE